VLQGTTQHTWVETVDEALIPLVLHATTRETAIALRKNWFLPHLYVLLRGAWAVLGAGREHRETPARSSDYGCPPRVPHSPLPILDLRSGNRWHTSNRCLATTLTDRRHQYIRVARNLNTRHNLRQQQGLLPQRRITSRADSTCRMGTTPRPVPHARSKSILVRQLCFINQTSSHPLGNSLTLAPFSDHESPCRSGIPSQSGQTSTAVSRRERKTLDRWIKMACARPLRRLTRWALSLLR
jgi:hypothetical protein